MPLRTVRVNTCLKEKVKNQEDKISKIFVVCAWVLGTFKLPVVFNIKGFYKISAIIYSLTFGVSSVCYVLYTNPHFLFHFVVLVNLAQYLICIIVSMITWKTLKKFYLEIIEFDEEIGYKFLINSEAKINLVQAVATCFILILINILTYYKDINNVFLLDMLPLDLNYILEMYYYGNLFILLNNRLKSIRVLLLLSFPTINQLASYTENNSINRKDQNISNILKKNSRVDVRKLLLLYFRIIKAYDFLNAAIKWQFLIMLATSFVNTLDLTYHASSHIIKNEFNLDEAIFNVGKIIVEVAPIVTPCKWGENIHSEVSLLRSAFYSRTYNNVFDKNSRSIASSFLALTEARTLSFSLFRMIEVNVSLPFKLFGLLASYVVILLQFQKVLNFDRQ